MAALSTGPVSPQNSLDVMADGFWTQNKVINPSSNINGDLLPVGEWDSNGSRMWRYPTNPYRYVSRYMFVAAKNCVNCVKLMTAFMMVDDLDAVGR